jgi:hypothetical protein
MLYAVMLHLVSLLWQLPQTTVDGGQTPLCSGEARRVLLFGLALVSTGFAVRP